MRNTFPAFPFHRALTLAAFVAAIVRAAPAPDPISAVIDQAHLQLSQGHASRAAEPFAQAASHGEFADAEIGEVRARLWAGQMQHAVAISTAVAGEHPESGEAQALLAYIEDRNGYGSQALQRAHREQQNHPGDVTLIAAEAEILIDRHRAPEAIRIIDRYHSARGVEPDLCRLRARAVQVTGSGPDYASPCGSIRSSDPGPAASKSEVAGSRWFEFSTTQFPSSLGDPVRAGNGVIVDGGRQIVTFRALVDIPSASIWVRNALGELRRARIKRGSAEESGALAFLTLDKPFPQDHSVDVQAPADAHGLCFALSYPAAGSTDALLPVVTPCYAFGLPAKPGDLQINVPISEPERGSPVFDSQGELLGLVEPAPTRPVVVRVTRPHEPLQPGGHQPPAIAMPELYERLAPAVVQVVVFGS